MCIYPSCFAVIVDYSMMTTIELNLQGCIYTVHACLTLGEGLQYIVCVCVKIVEWLSTCNVCKLFIIVQV